MVKTEKSVEHISVRETDNILVSQQATKKGNTEMNLNLKGTWEERNETRRAKAEKIYNERKMEIVNTRSSHCDDYLIYDYVTIRTFNQMNEARFLTAIISRPNEYKGSFFNGVDVLIKVAERSQNDMLIGSITDEAVKDAQLFIQNFLIQ